MIARSSIQKVVETSRVEEVVRDYVDLKTRGANLTGLCPFHKEKTPSFLYPRQKIFINVLVVERPEVRWILSWKSNSIPFLKRSDIWQKNTE
ncbi:MAG: hypothetical protein IPG87_14850 [Saprospiraceae bacterium]|nr:hypothetical protein [Candidatus Vicinibacter affinis]